MLVRHLCFNQNSYLKTENLLFLHIRSSRSKSLEHQDSPCLFSRLPVCILTRTYMYSIVYMCALSNICVLDCTYLYILEHMCTPKYDSSCINYLFWNCILLLETCLGKLLFLGTPKYLVKKQCILLRFAKKRFCIELWYFIQVNLSN